MTDLAIQIPEKHYGRIAPRSGLALKHFINIDAGVINANYRGNIRVLMFNHLNSKFQVKKRDKIAQLIFEKISTPILREVKELFQTK